MCMATKSAVKNAVSEDISTELSHFKFHLRDGLLVWQLNPEFTGIVGLNFSTHRPDGLVGLNPVVSIACRRIEEAIVELSDGAERKPLPSLSSALGYLTPELRFLEWLFEPSAPKSDRIPESQRIAKAIELYGITFLKEHASIEVIARCLEEGKYSYNERAVYHLPVAYWLLGEKSKAGAYIQQQLSDLKDRSDVAATQYRRFGDNFLSRHRRAAI